MPEDFEVPLEEGKIYKPGPEYREHAQFKDYELAYQEFLHDQDGFWNRIASELDGTLHVIPGAGHYPHAEMSDATVAPIAEFLSTVWKEAEHGA